MRSGGKVCKKWWVGSWIQTINQIPTKTLLFLFGPFTIFLEICVQILWVVFASSREINKQKHAETKILLCAGNKMFVKYQAQGGGYNPTPPLLTPLVLLQTTKPFQCVSQISSCFWKMCAMISSSDIFVYTSGWNTQCNNRNRLVHASNIASGNFF